MSCIMPKRLVEDGGGVGKVGIALHQEHAKTTELGTDVRDCMPALKQIYCQLLD